MHVFILTFEWNLFSAIAPSSSEEQRAAVVQLQNRIFFSAFGGGHWLDINLEHVLMIVGETEARRGNPHRKALPSQELNPGPCCCEATVLTTTPPCCNRVDSDSKVSCLQVKKRNYIFVQNASNPKRDPRCKRRFSRHAMNRELSLGPLHSWWKTCAPSNCKAARFIFSGH